MEHGWWYSDGAAIAVYTFNGTEFIGASWPGTRMTLVETNIWQAEIADNAPSCIFTRVNANGDIVYWDAKTADLTIPTDGKNLFTISSTEPIWGDPGCSGEWSVYTTDNPDNPDDGCTDGPYGILLNDSVVEATPAEEFEGYKQYLAKAYVSVGDTCRLINISCDQTWMVDLNESSVSAFTGGKTEGWLVCTTAGCYDFYIKLKANADQLYIGEGTGCPNEPIDPDNPDNPEDPEDKPYEPGTYTTSVPENCPDVMLQGFYWDSYKTTAKHGDTKWASLNAQASEIAAYFDLVWLPPSAKASGHDNGGVGYIPRQYSNQNNAWGTRADLEKFITAMHAGGTKVIADIVINHAGNESSWCDYLIQDFGQFGVFEPDASWICNTDEVNNDSKAGSCKGKATGASDQGYLGEANYPDARDWDHSNPEVRSMFEAYLKWMKNEMKFDGWRYDYCKGFKGQYINQYNKAAANYFSVTEFWDGNPATLQSYLNDCGYNTLTFDFATKYTAFNDGIAAGNYGGCRGAGLPGAGKSRWAVTFVDSHDSYQRDGNEFCGAGNSMKAANKGKVLQANAYILSMPGVPCVFYPHWKEYKANISKMVLARQATGVHSQSAVSDEAGSGFYKATITGTNGEIRLLLGPNSGYNSTPSGYTLADKGDNYGVYYKINNPVAPRLIITPGSQTFKDNTKGITITMIAIAGDATKNVIYYTTDGTNPKTSETRQQYTTPFTIKETTTVKAYAASGEIQTKVQTYTYTYKAPQTTPITVRFQKPTAWEKVYLYSWTGAESKETKHTGEWPGTELTVQDSDGWYYYQFDAALKAVNFIFNIGSNVQQTADLWTDEDVCYAWRNGAEYLVEDCVFTGIEDVEIEEPSSVANKILINGQLYILRDGVVYTVLGTQVQVQ